MVPRNTPPIIQPAAMLELSVMAYRHSINISDCFLFSAFLDFYSLAQSAFPDLGSTVSFAIHACWKVTQFIHFVNSKEYFQGLPVCTATVLIPRLAALHILESMCRQRKNRVTSHDGSTVKERGNRLLCRILTSLGWGVKAGLAGVQVRAKEV